MGRYIDADNLLAELDKFINVNSGPQYELRIWQEGMNCAKSVVGSITTADVRENVRGKWNKTAVSVRCSVCKEGWNFITGVPAEVYDDFNYCPFCGAKMEG